MKMTLGEDNAKLKLGSIDSDYCSANNQVITVSDINLNCGNGGDTCYAGRFNGILC